MIALSPKWLTTIAALIAALATIGTLIIAWRQWRTEQAKLKLDLFEKRYAIYAAVLEFMKSVNAYGNATHDDVRRFQLGVSQCEFLFDSKIDLALIALTDDVFELQTLNLTLEGNHDPEVRKTNLDQQRAVRERMDARFHTLNRQFIQYLKLHH